jgi:hypothetical protein
MSTDPRIEALLDDLKAEDLVRAEAAAVNLIQPAIRAFATTVTDITLRRVFIQDYVNNLEVDLGYKEKKTLDEYLLAMSRVRPATYYDGSRKQVLIADDVKRCTI